MKKISLLGMLVMLLGSAFAQSSHGPQFGLKAGVNTATFNTSGTSSVAGLNAGAFAHIHVSPHFALQPEVVYSQQGAKLANNETQRVNYINVPVLGQYMFGNGLRLQTGPQVGFRTDAAIKHNGHSNSNNDAYTSADFAWSFGAGYLSPVGLGIDARYNLGVTDITKGGSDISNRVLQVGLFYQFK